MLQGLHRTWAPLTDFTHALADELGHPVQANCYVTPPANQGFAPHYDVHDVFVLQVHGTKEWTVHPPVRTSPLRTEPWGDRAAAVGEAATAEPLLRVVLEPGDCLYLPRGFVHSARALGGITAHLTLGVHTWTAHHLATALTEAALARIAEDPAVRASLPVGVTVGDTAEVGVEVDRVRAALAAALTEIPDDTIAAALAGQARASMRARAVPVFAEDVEN